MMGADRPLVLRDRRLLVRALCHGAALAAGVLVMLLGSAAGADGPATAGALFLLFYLLAFRRLPWIGAIERHVLKEETCATCGYCIPLQNWWACACGFKSPYERHALLPCSGCRREFTFVECPECGVSILL